MNRTTSASKFISECNAHRPDCPASKTGQMEDCMCRSHMGLKTKAPTHTPGPWRIERYNYPGSQRITIEDWTPDGIKSQVARLEKRDAWEANACLIAAAPEMLERLEQIRDWANNHAREMMHVGPSSASDFLHDAIGETQELVKDIEAAIQKARGGQ